MKQPVKKQEKKSIENLTSISCDKGSELGVVKIHENVISSLVRKAALSVDGVSRLSGSSFVDNIAEIVGSRKIHDRSISISIDVDKIDVEIKINIKFGFKVPDLAAAVQSAVIRQVEDVTGMTVVGVNVIIQEIEDVAEEETEEEA